MLLTIMLIFTTASAGAVQFQWEQAPSAVWGTKIYIGTSSGVYSNSEDAGINTTEYTLASVLEYNTTYYFTATHYNTSIGLESIKAEEIVWTSPGPDEILFNPLTKKQEHPIKSYIFKFFFK